MYQWSNLLTYALTVDACPINRTARITSATSNTNKSLTDLSTAAVIISATQWFADSWCKVTTFITQATYIWRTDGTACIIQTRGSCWTFPVLSAWLTRDTNTGNFGCWVWYKSTTTWTTRPLIWHCAYCIRATRRITAWIHTSVVSTWFTGTTVIIRMASIDAHVVKTYVTKETVIIHTTSHWNETHDSCCLNQLKHYYCNINNGSDNRDNDDYDMMMIKIFMIIITTKPINNTIFTYINGISEAVCM